MGGLWKSMNICDIYKEQLSDAREKYPRLASEISQSQINRYIQCTCALEGSCLPQWAVNKILAGLRVEGFEQKDILLIQNQMKSLEYARELSERQLNVNDVERLMVELDEGKYRTATIVNSPSPTEIPRHMKIIINLINNNPSRLHPIRLATYIYYLIMWVAPFESRNGMLARLLANIILGREGYPKIIFDKDYSDIMFKDLRHFSNIIETCVFQSTVIYASPY
jgi:hypothetical protein